MHQTFFLDGHTFLLKQDVITIKNVIRRVVHPVATKRYIKAVEALGNYYELQHLAVLNLSKSSKEYLPKLFSTYQKLVALWWIVIPLSIELEEYIRKNWPRVPDDILFEVTKPAQATWLELQHQEIISMALMVRKAFPNRRPESINVSLLKSNPSLWFMIRSHVQKFVWFGTHHWMGQAYTTNHCLSQIKEVLLKPPKNKKVRLYRSIIPKRLTLLAAVLNYWRTHCAELSSKVIFLSRPALVKLAHRWGISYNDLIYLSHKEILYNISNNHLGIKLKKEINKRKVAYGCILGEHNREIIYTGKALDELLKKLIPSKTIKTKTILGTVASQGEKITGKVCVVMSPHDFQNFKKGNILVTNETTPDFVPLMKIARAIITDIGGITSHAAIVSRELNIPCIIGTKIATKALKDGDKVEVDATNGIIKKLQ
ncbi:hypothetical protein HYZ76_01900 [Candidatus Falkowbacteria bacterium]|nr:hypothetical protein [Candidatus Falkowbacteria bacterium]